MLASDSDSEFEYPADTNDSDASSDIALKGQLALGIDPQEAKAYDGKSTPLNGSQYLLMVMKEKKTTPKVAYADTSKLPVKKMSQVAGVGVVDGGENKPLQNKDFLEMFFQRCSLKAEELAEDGNSSVMTPSKWRDEVVSKFSMARTRVERLCYKIENEGLVLQDTPRLPQNNENLHWLRFCYGLSFSKLAALQKSRTLEQKLSDFFLDLFDQETAEKLLGDVESVPKIHVPDETEAGISEADHGDDGSLSSTDSVSSADKTTEIKSEPSQPAQQRIVGHKPVMSILMRLSQPQLENLIKWNLLWVKTYGFVNQCQGQWIYSLFACLPKPIDPSVMSDMREITRVLMKMRDTECYAMLEQEGLNADKYLYDFINSFNLLVYIVADYFQQKDLVMKL